MPPPVPTVGRIVNYWPKADKAKDQPYPAIITHVWGPNVVNLHKFGDGSFPHGENAMQTSVSRCESDEPVAGCWSWPPISAPSIGFPEKDTACPAAVRDRADVQPTTGVSTGAGAHAPAEDAAVGDADASNG